MTRAQDYLGRYMLLVVWAATIAVFGYLRPDTFLTTANFESMLGSQAVLVVLALGLLIPFNAGDYDLSSAYVLTLSGMLVAVLNVNHGWAIGWAIAGALAVGVLVGLVNGLVIVLLDIDSLIVTLGTGTFIAGVVLWVSDSMTVSGIDPRLSSWVVEKRIFGISLGFYYGLALCAVLWYVLEFTPMGRRLLFVGQSRNVSRLSGIAVGRIRIGAFVTAGLVSALAGVLYAGTLGAADPTSGITYLLPAFAAAFLGSTAIIPGRFNPWGTFVAVYFLITGITGLTLLGAETYVQSLFYGGALVIAVALSQLAKRRSADAA